MLSFEAWDHGLEWWKIVIIIILSGPLCWLGGVILLIINTLGTLAEVIIEHLE